MAQVVKSFRTLAWLACVQSSLNSSEKYSICDPSTRPFDIRFCMSNDDVPLEPEGLGHCFANSQVGLRMAFQIGSIFHEVPVTKLWYITAFRYYRVSQYTLVYCRINNEVE